MFNIPNPKKASLIICVLLFLLLTATSVLLLISETIKSYNDLNTNLIIDYIRTLFTTNGNWTTPSFYFTLVLTFGPVLFGIIGLFGRLFRLPNILVFAMIIFWVGIYSYKTVVIDNTSIFNFASIYNVCVSTSLICQFLAFILSFTNLIKSK
jgi:hypothetical protein